MRWLIAAVAVVDGPTNIIRALMMAGGQWRMRACVMSSACGGCEHARMCCEGPLLPSKDESTCIWRRNLLGQECTASTYGCKHTVHSVIGNELEHGAVRLAGMNQVRFDWSQHLHTPLSTHHTLHHYTGFAEAMTDVLLCAASSSSLCE